MKEKVTISIPARAEFLHVIRSVAAAVGARYDFPYESIEDLRMAVDEACSQLLIFGPPATEIEIDFLGSNDVMEIVVGTDGHTSEWPPPKAKESFAWRTLSVLADEAVYEVAEKGPVLKLLKRAGDARS